MSELETNPFEIQPPINDTIAREYAERFMQISHALIEIALEIPPEFRIDTNTITEKADGLIVLEKSGIIEAGINVTDTGRAHDIVRVTVRGEDSGITERFTRGYGDTAWNTNGTRGHTNYVRRDRHGRAYLQNSSQRAVEATAANFTVINRSIALAVRRQRIEQGKRI